MGSNGGDEEEGENREHWKEETNWKLVFNKKIQNIRRFLEDERWHKIVIVLLIIQVSLLDPLFFYIPVINDRQKCVSLDKKLGTAVMVFRSLIDSFYVMYIIAQLQHHYTKLGKWLFLLDFLTVLPLPQVVILIFIPAMRGSRFLNAMYLLRSVVLCQFVPRSFRAYLFITSGTFGVPAKARFKFSPLIFLLGIDVIGAFWYFLSIERLVQCWTKACKTHVGCVNSFYCKDNIGDHTSLKHFCPRDGQKTDFLDFGIFSNALQHRVLEMTYFPKKLLYCFQWSLQNLSGFGQNLQTSTYIGENLLAISMSILGLLLFFLLLGNLQTYMESQRMESQRKEESQRMESQRKEESAKKKLKAIESIENWPPLEKLPVNLRKDIKKHLKYYWEKYTTEAGIILYELPTDLKRRIECEHGLELLEKVKAFKAIGKKLLDDLSRSIELKLFDESEYIVEEGKTINDMVFILHGKLEASSYVNYRLPFNVLKDGDIYGEEVAWDIVFNDLSPSFELRVSRMTVKVLTRVYALVLPVNKVRDVFHCLSDDLRRSARHELCFDFLEKVKAFKGIGQNLWDDLSESIKLKLFDEGEDIAQEGKTINDMVFILQGKLVSSSSLDRTTKIKFLKDGDICGEEVTWEVIFRDWWPSSKLWGSTVTIKALMRVHALVLPADKVRDFLCRLPNDLQRSARRELYFDFLKEVKVLKHIGQNELDDLSGSIQMKLFNEGEYIVEERKTINDIVFIVHGKLEARSSLEYYLLKDGDICGEVVARNGFIGDWSSDQLPLSTVTIETVTKVHALVLPVQRVRDFLHHLPDDLQRNIHLEV